VRFVPDQDVDARVVGLLVKNGQEAWTVAAAGIPDAQDDDISVYAAEKNAVVVTHDIEFSARRRRNPHGRHVHLGCSEPDAVELIKGCLAELVAAIEPFTDVFVYVSKDGISSHLKWT
jgi:predicted nuclease of predicted toxin-antitoxin system